MDYQRFRERLAEAKRREDEFWAKIMDPVVAFLGKIIVAAWWTWCYLCVFYLIGKIIH